MSDFVSALHEKYVDQEEFDDNHKIPKDRSITTEITFVGFGVVSSVQKQLRMISSIDLSGRSINSAGDICKIFGLLDRVTILNLAGNRLSWQELIKILTCLPNLREIVISHNDLRVDRQVIDYPPTLFRKLHSITMGQVGLDWLTTLDTISRIWAAFEQIDLWDSQLDGDKMRLAQSEKTSNITEKISALRLSQNNFTDIDWITSSGKLNNLKELDLSRCKLQSIHISESVRKTLSQLEVLNISYNSINDWASISCLNFLASLVCLICNENPFFTGEKFSKSLVVARVGNLKLLNREEITKTIRRDSEILYVRRAFEEYKTFKKGTNLGFLELHPRYQELADTYGLPEDLDTKKQVEKYVNVTLHYDGQRVVKKMPLDMRVSNFQMLCKRLFKLSPSSKVVITCCAQSTEKGATSYPLDQESQTLHFFSIKNNYNLILEAVD